VRIATGIEQRERVRVHGLVLLLNIRGFIFVVVRIVFICLLRAPLAVDR
jgi:hypothetical protein